jgi:hypothetical protein
MRALQAAAAVVLLIGGVAVYYWLAGNQPLAFGLNETPKPQSAAVIAYGYAVTIAGVILGSTYRELQAKRARGIQRIDGIGPFVRDVFLSIDFWMSACGSPIVYALLWKSLEGGGTAALTIVALQNGFCCTVMLDRLTRQTTQPEHPVTNP